MRVGHNPNFGKPVDGLENIVLSVITHLPNLLTYHAKRLEIVQTCLTTMRQGAHAEHTFAVWDNGSIPELQNWLQYDFKPDMLILSPNVGKAAAKTSLIRMFPENAVIGISDDDMLFYDNWLLPQIELLQHFPNVACVTGYPVRTSFRWGIENTVRWAYSNGKLEKGDFIPQQWEDDFAVSVGREPDWHREYTKDDIDYRVTYKGKQAYCTSHHCQFIGYQKQLVRATGWDGQAMGPERNWDIALDKIGLRLATTQRLSRHIGNVIHDELRKEISKE